MLFVDSHSFRSKSNKSAIFAKPTFYEFPIIVWMRNPCCKHCAELNLFFFYLTFTTHQCIACNVALAKI